MDHAEPVIIVVLRRPGRTDARDDPFWEFGSFGCTNCHAKNLMNPNRINELNDVRLAFAQGGPDGFRLVYLTPPVRAYRHPHVSEVRWKPERRRMPLRYSTAPVLACNGKKSDFPTLRRRWNGASRSTEEGRFASTFRSNRSPLPEVAALEVIRVFTERYEQARPDGLARFYWDALPKQPMVERPDRRARYRELLRAPKTAGDEGSCSKPATRREC